MEAILPFKIKNEQKFFESALKVGYNEMEALKFIYVMQQSDLDIFPKMHDERINMLLYGWELCEDYKQNLNPNEWELPEEMETILKLLVAWSMDIWFSKEWDKSKYILKSALIHCLNRARDLLMRMPDMMQINWDFLLLYNLKPWNVLYLKNLTVTREKTLENGAQCIEMEELPATDEDISYVKLEQLPIIVLRLVKLFDQSSIDMVKTLCMRVIAAWNKIHQTELGTSGSRRSYIPPEDKRCLMLICHIYLMAVYESDDVKGYVIDNMINNIRFYNQGFQNTTPLHVMNNLEYTPARYIALTSIHLRVQKRDFFDFFIWNKYDTALVNLFGVVSQSYKSYLLGNLLMELNNMNEDDFASNIPLYKRLMNSYVNEREKSEIFLLNELTKIEAQRYAHNVILTVKNVTDFKSKICKGNRMSNIGNYENSDDTVTPLVGTKIEDENTEIKEEEIKEEVIDEEIDVEQKRIKESELRLDPVFQNLPNNESMLYYVYDVLAKKEYNGWHFAKVVLLIKIIGLEQNMIETWRYHPGLTTDFMLNLEEKLSQHYVDLAKIFKSHPFLEQEFWLTAFYLNPTTEIYEVIKRLGMRNNRKRTDEQIKLVMNIDNIEAKYGLLSSTIDVKELATLSNTDEPVTDYDPLFSALHSLRVPDSLIKDMLTAIFLPRNRRFAWAVDWVILRNRCKMIMTSSKEKKRFVDLNMAEANERLKFLIIDYEKYKNRPQLDYGTIEQGYENLMSGGDFDKDTDEEEEDEEEEDFEDDEDVYESKKRGRGRPPGIARKKEEEKVEDDNSQEDDPFLMGKRRTRARTAATLASFLFQTLPRSSRRKRNQKLSEEETKVEEEKGSTDNDEKKISVDNDDKSSDSKSPIPSETPTPSPVPDCGEYKDTIDEVSSTNLKECLKERPTFSNTKQGFQNLIDIWNVEKSDLESIDKNCVYFLESSSILHIAAKLKRLNQEINPLGCDEKEYIDDDEMLIYNSEYAIKKEYDLNVVKEEVKPHVLEQTKNFEEIPVPMEVEGYEENETGLKAMEIDHSQEFTSFQLPQAEENTSESINSDLSIAANKDSGEVSESNTETNSKRNSLNIDSEMDDKILQVDDISKQNEIANDIREIVEPANIETNDNEAATKFEEITGPDLKETNAFDTPTKLKNITEADLKGANKDQEDDSELNKVTDYVEDKPCEEKINASDDIEDKELEVDGENEENSEHVPHEEKSAREENEIEKRNRIDVVNISEKESKAERGSTTTKECIIAKQNISKEENESNVENKEEENKKDDILPSPKSENEIKKTAENKASDDSKVDEEYQAQKENNLLEENEKEEANKTEKEFEASEILIEMEKNKVEEENKVETKNEDENKSGVEYNRGKEYKTENKDKAEKENEADKDADSDKSKIDETVLADLDNKKVEETEKLNNDIKNLETEKTLEEEISVLHDAVIKDFENSTSLDEATNYAEEIVEESGKYLIETTEANVSEEILKNDDVSIPEVIKKLNTELKDSEDIQQYENETCIKEKVLNEERKETEENGRSIKTPSINSAVKVVSEDLIKKNDSSQENISNTFKTQQKEENEITTEDKDCLSQCQDQESDLILHYSSSEELDGKDETIRQMKQDATENKKPTDFKTDEENVKIADEPYNETKVATIDWEKAIEASLYQKRPGIAEMEIETSDEQMRPRILELNKVENTSSNQTLHEIDWEKVIEASCDQMIPRTPDCDKTENASSNRTHGTSDYKKTEQVLSNQTLYKNENAKENLKTTFELLLDANSTDSFTTSEKLEVSDVETQYLKNLCLTKSTKVLLSKLKPSDFECLRQPKVKIQRMSFERYQQEQLSKRSKLEEKVYLEFDESSNSNNSFGSSSSEAYRPPRITTKIPVRRHSLRQTRASHSDYDSNNSEDVKRLKIMPRKRKRCISPPSTSQSSISQHITGPKSARKSGPKSKRKVTGPKSMRQTTGPKSSKQNLVVTPRSASGLKLRISNAEQKRKATGPKSKKPREILYEDIIQLSSSSSDGCLWNDLTAIKEEENFEVEEYALFEEEITIN